MPDERVHGRIESMLIRAQALIDAATAVKDPNNISVAVAPRDKADRGRDRHVLAAELLDTAGGVVRKASVKNSSSEAKSELHTTWSWWG